MFKLNASQVPLIRSKTGLFLATENGGGRTNTGYAEVWCSAGGEPLRAVYVPRKGQLACGTHAWVDVSTEPRQPGCWQIVAEHHRGDFEITVRQVRGLYESSLPAADVPLTIPSHEISPNLVSVMWADMKEVCHFSEGEWDEDPSVQLLEAIEAAKTKAQCYHCREPHFARETHHTAEAPDPEPPIVSEPCDDCPNQDGTCSFGDETCRIQREGQA